MHCFSPCTPIISTGHCPPPGASPCAAWMPRKGLEGRTCGASATTGGQGGPAAAPQITCTAAQRLTTAT
ncbi:hypothetical protein DGM85_06415 [Xanthomonas phaseoli pv. phaseoli]|nr:hypothetical protein DGM93_16180 [Xanthomonas phaseoli pv. phaseoli]QWN28203.1 hypothetical protein DGM85_06415 [Xanthomonas phaseoli pv. phaseoli]QWN33950.1 hypothetical protein DGM81_15940 [Xanthomonas phaseoli pv. phaseoli]